MTFNAALRRLREKCRKTQQKDNKTWPRRGRLIFHLLFWGNINYPRRLKKINFQWEAVFLTTVFVIFRLCWLSKFVLSFPPNAVNGFQKLAQSRAP